MWLAFLTAFLVLRADFRRRRMEIDPYGVILWAAFAGIVGAKLYHVLERPSELAAHPLSEIFDTAGFAWFGGFLAGVAALVVIARRHRTNLLLFLDTCSPAAALGYAVGRIGCLISGDGDYGVPTSLPWGMSFPNGLVPTTDRVHPTPIYEFLAGAVIFYYLWRKGSRFLLGPRPEGEILAEYLILSGSARFLVEFIRINPRSVLGMFSNAQAMGLASAIAGVGLLIYLKRNFRRMKGEHRILKHIDRQGDAMQPEYHRATAECPAPQRWRMYDSMTAEVEVLDFLKTLVTTLKPELVVETGTFTALSTLKIAEGLKENGTGKVITCEADPVVYAKAKERIESSGLAEWIDCRNQRSLEMKIEKRIDLLFCDSDPDVREAEVRHFLEAMNPNGIILMHDASSHLKVVREAALRLESEGLISVTLLPTPRGLVFAQKRAGRR